MTTLAVPSVRVASPDRAGALRALARVEAVRMLRSPATIASAALFLAPWIYGWISGSGNRYPSLADDTLTVQFLTLLILGSGTMIAANLATLRSHRHRADEFFDVLVLPPSWRTGALLLALAAPAGLALVLAGARLGIEAALPDAAGRLNWLEVLTVPALVALMGSSGVLLGRVVRSGIVAPLVALFLVAAAFVVPVGGSSGARYRLLFPTVSPEFAMPVPTEILARPTGRHLLYLVGLILVICVLALLRSGARRVWLAGGVALTLVVFGGVTQFRVPSSVASLRETATTAPASMQTCRVVRDVKYCAFDDFTPWVPGWAGVVRDVRSAVPDVPASGLVVRQRVLAVGYPGAVRTADQESARLSADQRANAAAGTPDAIPVGTTWGSPSDSAIFAGAVAYRLITGHAWTSGQSVCGSRGALLVWLVGRAAPDGLRELDASSWNALVFGDLGGYATLAVPDVDASSGLALVSKPGGAAAVREHWAELTAPGTSTARFAELTGVAAAPQPPENERATCDR
ncbi:hypothetical protein [Cryptosporangium sp. NPDC051539]|uniref:hypothetical protein n=1 Tax=Cryptosporangium sp. NPDC051539 TaxID=3363962 RepID=UPI0037A92D87